MIESRAGFLMRQASSTAHDYMHRAIHDIDEEFGEGFAKAQPSLVGAYMQTAAADFAACFQADQLEQITEKLQAIADYTSTSELADEVRKWRTNGKAGKGSHDL
jgi:hypothetical protein